jgi:hypothetical protein
MRRNVILSAPTPPPTVTNPVLVDRTDPGRSQKLPNGGLASIVVPPPCPPVLLEPPVPPLPPAPAEPPAPVPAVVAPALPVLVAAVVLAP